MRIMTVPRPALALLLLAVLSCSDVPGPLAPVALPVGEPSLEMGGGKLLACPASETATATGTIGMGGGRIELGGHALVIPKGALASPQRFRIDVQSSPHLVISFHAEEQDHFEFLQPATITLNYSRCEEEAESSSDLHVYYVDPVTLAILEDVGGLLDAAANTVSAQTSHLSDYAVGSPQ